jgi:gluconate 2-dehydrogenase gamma chain
VVPRRSRVAPRREAKTKEAPRSERLPSFASPLLARQQVLTLEDLAEQIIPESDAPGACRAEVPAFIEAIVRDVFDEAERAAFLVGLDALDVEARRAESLAFTECDVIAQGRVVAGVLAGAQSDPQPALVSFLIGFRELVIDGFCRSKLGATRVLQYEPVPGDYQACVSLTEVGRAWATSASY